MCYVMLFPVRRANTLPLCLFPGLRCEYMCSHQHPYQFSCRARDGLKLVFKSDLWILLWCLLTDSQPSMSYTDTYIRHITLGYGNHVTVMYRMLQMTSSVNSLTVWLFSPWQPQMSQNRHERVQLLYVKSLSIPFLFLRCSKWLKRFRKVNTLSYSSSSVSTVCLSGGRNPHFKNILNITYSITNHSSVRVRRSAC